jgi:hypothetical protein
MSRVRPESSEPPVIWGSDSYALQGNIAARVAEEFTQAMAANAAGRYVERTVEYWKMQG